jgi:hypothetical protein
MRVSGKLFRHGANALEIEVEGEFPLKCGTITLSPSDVHRIEIGETYRFELRTKPCQTGYLIVIGKAIDAENQGPTFIFSVTA